MTLRRKIVSLTLSLLLLFAMTAAASPVLQHKITLQFSGVVDDYLPLNAAVATGSPWPPHQLEPIYEV